MLLFALETATVAVASPVLVQTPGPLSFSSGRPSSGSLGLLGRVDVGSSNVAIDQIGGFGQVSQNLSLKWLIFDGTFLGNPLFQTSAVAFGLGGQQWFDSPVFSPFSLLANTTYFIGVAVDGPENSFTQFFNVAPGADETANGLTLVGPTSSGASSDRSNGNVVGSFDRPAGNPFSGTSQPGLRLFGGANNPTDVPAPATLALFGFGLAGLAVAGRRRKGG